MSPTEISALLLQHLLQLAAQQLPPYSKLVLTVPARFSADQRAATLEAACLAGTKPELLQGALAFENVR